MTRRWGILIGGVLFVVNHISFYLWGDPYSYFSILFIFCLLLLTAYDIFRFVLSKYSPGKRNINYLGRVYETIGFWVIFILLLIGIFFIKDPIRNVYFSWHVNGYQSIIANIQQNTPNETPQGAPGSSYNYMEYKQDGHHCQYFKEKNGDMAVAFFMGGAGIPPHHWGYVYTTRENVSLMSKVTARWTLIPIKKNWYFFRD